MNNVLIDQAETGYQLAEQKAAQYFTSLHEQLMNNTYTTKLTQDFQLWQKKHIHRYSWLPLVSRSKRKPDSRDVYRYIQWLNVTGKLDDYLDRSISYIYMRDLGKALDSPETQARIQRVARDTKKYFMRSSSNAGKRKEQPDYISVASLYRWAQKENVETAVIWLIQKLKNVASNIPKELDAEQAQRKLIKIILGVVLHVNDEMDEMTPIVERSQRFDAAIRLGYSYGLTYPFIDDLLDSQALSLQEKEQYSQMIRQALLTGIVPDIGQWNGANQEVIQYVHSELREAFEYIKNYQRPEMQRTFFEQSYVFFQSQELDRAKKISNANYTNEELYVPIIIKSSSSRLIVRSVLSASEDEGFDLRTFYYGIYNQLADDFADMFDDMEEGAVTPYTYYLKYRDLRPDLINPYELYWTVISHLIHSVYDSDEKTREVILDRAINGLKRSKERLGQAKYNEIMNIFASGQPEFNQLVQQMVRKADDVDFLDKLLRDQVIVHLQNDKKEKEDFLHTIRTVREQINIELQISKPTEIPEMKETLIDAANYSLQGDGKRLRPILTWVMGVREYGLTEASIVPLLRSLEYMHTASLIFDDLPTQDNASTRRGRSTLHQVHNSATAELTGLFLIQKAIGEQSSLGQFDAATVLTLIRYSAEKAEDMCMGQAMDLNSKGKALTLEQLNMICFYKTGIAFEAALVMPAILAQVKESEIASLKKFAYHAGIAFQIKDDLLDLEGDHLVLGKPAGQDARNNNSTFVSILGEDGAKKEMWEHYCLATDALNDMPKHVPFLKHLLDYIVGRER
ncbi:polyprenyl synthetase family protein [Paenibacillus xylanilyticus]|uniref:Polyprenyl synthetase family protein n=1 Tax=Paenibacillus xylanilyticus TaxID=248903 RepID=A0A7Y6BXL6_9BACL|nr:polyprenyl synthetase family protein [Paenibacillus xylanilyticus]NUU76701.1 polyprenyl synthetase family protein [Paenibacillus xylanilyticus]